MPRVVSVDLDDTLIRSEALKRKVLLDIVEEFEGGHDVIKNVNTDARVSGVKCTRFTIFRDFAHGLHEASECSESAKKKLQDGPPPDVLGAQLADRYSELVKKSLAEADEVPGAQKFLEHLFNHQLPVYINSATPQEALTALVKQRGWLPLVAHAFGSPVNGGDKVDSLAAIAAHAGASVTDILHIGDGDNDSDAATRFGCNFVRVRESPELSQHVGCKENVVRDMHEATDFVCQWAGLTPPPLHGPVLKCRICEKNALPEKIPYGGPIWQNDRWLLLHASSPPGVAGWCMLHTKRHIVGPTDFDDVEAAEFGVLLRRLQTALLKASGAKRVYIAAMSESSPHFHMHLVPREHTLPPAAKGGGFALFGLQDIAKAHGSVGFDPVDEERVKEIVAALKLDLCSTPPFN